MAMTARQLLAQGVTPRRERGPVEKLAYLLQTSTSRFNLLPWTLEARASNLRAAGRRYRIRMGMSKNRASASYKIGACNCRKPVVECSHAGAHDAAGKNGAIKPSHRGETEMETITGTLTVNGVDYTVQVCTFYKDHKGIYSSFRLPGTRGSVNITNKMFIGGVVPQFIVVSGLVPANSEVPAGDAEKAAAKAEAARVKAEAAQAKATARAEKAQAAATKAQAQAAAALERANKAAEAAKNRASEGGTEPAADGDAASM